MLYNIYGPANLFNEKEFKKVEYFQISFKM